MSTASKSFTATGAGVSLTLRPGETLSYSVSGTFVGTVQLQENVGSGAWETTGISATAAASGTLKNDSLQPKTYRWFCTAFTSGTIVTSLADVDDEALQGAGRNEWKNGSGQTVFKITEDGIQVRNITGADDVNLIGAVASVTGLACSIKRMGNIARLDFTFTSVAVTHTDAAGSGSSGSLKIFDFVPGVVQPLASRSDLTLTSDTTMDVAGDMAGVFAFGSAAANAGDGALTGTEVDFAATTAFTLSSNTLAVGTSAKGVGTAIDGTSTAVDLYFNESGSAATSDANGVLTINGTASFLVALLGDD